MVPDLSTYATAPTNKRKGGTASRAASSKKHQTAPPNASNKRKGAQDEQGGSTKKRRKGDAEDPPELAFDVGSLKGYPEWTINAVRLLGATNLGAGWQSLVVA